MVWVSAALCNRNQLSSTHSQTPTGVILSLGSTGMSMTPSVLCRSFTALGFSQVTMELGGGGWRGRAQEGSVDDEG